MVFRELPPDVPLRPNCPEIRVAEKGEERGGLSVSVVEAILRHARTLAG